MVAKGSTIDIKVAGGSGTSIIQLTVPYDQAQQATFLMTVKVKDQMGTRTVINNETRNKSAGPEKINVEGLGSGTITVYFDGVLVMTQPVEF